MKKIKILSAIVCAVLVCLQVGQAYSPTHPYTTGKRQGPKYVKPQPTVASRSMQEPVKQMYEITAYTSGPESTGKSSGDKGYGITASGTKIKEGDCAASEEIPFGTRIFIDGVGVFVCTDRGGNIQHRHIDVYIPDLQQALKFGKQYHEVTMLGR